MMGKLSKEKKLAVLVGAGIIILGITTVTAAEVIHYNSYVLKNNSYTVELGNKIDTNTDTYIKAGNKKALVETKLDFTKVNVNQVGEYDASASYGGKTLNFFIDIKDTIAPSIEEKSGDLTAVTGQEVCLADYVGGIKESGNVTDIKVFDDDKVVVDGTDINDMKFSFTDAVVHALKVQAVDEAGNVGESNTIKIKVVKDYQNIISGFHDISVQEGDSVDWMNGIQYDNSNFSSVTPNTDEVDLNTAGTYTVIYTMVGDDGVSTFTRDISVMVTAKPKPVVQQSSSSGGSNHTTNPLKPNDASSNHDPNEFINEVIRLTNIEREKEGLTSLVKDDLLCQATTVRAKEIMEIFSHSRPDSRICFTAIDDIRKINTTMGENIAAGQLTPQWVVTSWMNSKGHRANILTPEFTRIGIGVGYGGAKGIYWAQMFSGNY